MQKGPAKSELRSEISVQTQLALGFDRDYLSASRSLANVKSGELSGHLQVITGSVQASGGAMNINNRRLFRFAAGLWR